MLYVATGRYESGAPFDMRTLAHGTFGPMGFGSTRRHAQRGAGHCDRVATFLAVREGRSRGRAARLGRGLLPAGKETSDRRSHLNNSSATDEVGGHA